MRSSWRTEVEGVQVPGPVLEVKAPRGDEPLLALAAQGGLSVREREVAPTCERVRAGLDGGGARSVSASEQPLDEVLAHGLLGGAVHEAAPEGVVVRNAEALERRGERDRLGAGEAQPSPAHALRERERHTVRVLHEGQARPFRPGGGEDELDEGRGALGQDAEARGDGIQGKGVTGL